MLRIRIGSDTYHFPGSEYDPKCFRGVCSTDLRLYTSTPDPTLMNTTKKLKKRENLTMCDCCLAPGRFTDKENQVKGTHARDFIVRFSHFFVTIQ